MLGKNTEPQCIEFYHFVLRRTLINIFNSVLLNVYVSPIKISEPTGSKLLQNGNNVKPVGSFQNFLLIIIGDSYKGRTLLRIC
jgi:hypothetical protein